MPPADASDSPAAASPGLQQDGAMHFFIRAKVLELLRLLRLIDKMLLEHHGTQGLQTLWVALVNAGGAAGTLLLPNRDPSPPAA